jgi:glycerophosphoryl diester phosphodiesterase
LKKSLKSSFFNAARPLVFGHRGSAGDMPENTIPSFDKALQDGADVLETDIHLTKDGKVVACHDSLLEGTTNGAGRIEDHTLAELKQLDAAYNFSRDGGKTFPLRGHGITIPTLDELFMRYKGVKFNIDMKTKDPALVKKVSEMIDNYGRADLTIMASFNHASIKGLRKLQGDVLTCASNREVMTFLLASKLGISAYKEPLSFEVPVKEKGINVVTKKFIKHAHAKGHFVVPWTVNDPKEMEALLKMGVDGIITDFPKLAADVVRKFKP